MVPAGFDTLSEAKRLNLIEKDTVIASISAVYQKITLPMNVFTSDNDKLKYIKETTCTFTSDPSLIAFTEKRERGFKMLTEMNYNIYEYERQFAISICPYNLTYQFNRTNLVAEFEKQNALNERKSKIPKPVKRAIPVLN